MRHLDHGPDDARRGDGRHDHHPLRRRRLRGGARPSWPRWSRSASARSDASPDHRFLQRRPSSACARCATRRRGETEGLFLAEGLRILAEARDSGRLARDHRLLAGRRRPSAGRRDHRRGRGRRAATSIETTPDILSKMSGKDNPQMLLGAYRQPDTALAAIDRVGVAAVDRRPGAARSGQYRHHPAHRRRGRRRRADPDRRQRRSLFGRGGARVDGRDLHPGGRDRALGRVPALAARPARASWSGPASRPTTTISTPTTSSPASCWSATKAGPARRL